MVNYFINKIKNTKQKPNSCIDCNGTNLKDDAVLAMIGTSELNGSYTPSVLCLDCETLMIIADKPEGVISLQHSVGNQATVRQ